MANDLGFDNYNGDWFPKMVGWVVIIGLAVFSILLGLEKLHCTEITISWDKNKEPDLAGYKVYYGTSPRNYDIIMDVGLGNELNGRTSHKLQLFDDRIYYFAVTAYDFSGNESEFSEEVAYSISRPVPPKLLSLDSVTVKMGNIIDINYELKPVFSNGTIYDPDNALLKFNFWPDGDWKRQIELYWNVSDTSVKSISLKAGWYQICLTVLVDGLESECSNYGFIKVIQDVIVGIKRLRIN